MVQKLDARPAGLFRRLAGMFYDSLLLVALLFALTGLLVAVNRGEALYPVGWWYPALLVATVILFFGWFWSHGGRTLGMQAWRMRLVTLDGRPPRLGHACLRALAAGLSWLPLAAGYWWLLIDPQRRTWHDRWCGTQVVVEPRRQPRGPQSTPAAVSERAKTPPR